MTEWILIIGLFYSSTGTAMVAPEFYTKEACEAARKEFVDRAEFRSWRFSAPIAICVYKGELGGR